MALVWQRVKNGVSYQVRSAGKSVRLYTNRVFHSQWNPNRILAGGVWDLLVCPTFLLPEPRILKRVLVLGVGGGAVIRSLDSCYALESITGVDLDPIHLSIAKRFFGVNVKAMSVEDLRLVNAEASAWLSSNRARHDFIVEDIFKEDDLGQPVRAIEASESWLAQLVSRLTSQGMLVMNFESQEQWQSTKKRMRKVHGHSFSSCAMFTLPQYENCIGVFSRVGLNIHCFEENVTRYAGVSASKLRAFNISITVTSF